ncbi:unnamed protein product [Lymnaea stagnalis]|uniref:valine--tRNA ligase n=1 Tax=Lymnaea stagnalis TaxID=6523 RepID=A0AAV2HYF3_LYMST
MAAPFSNVSASFRTLNLYKKNIICKRRLPCLMVDRWLNRNHLSSSFSSNVISKKDCSKPMGKTYDPAETQEGWYDWWVQKGYFKPLSRDAACQEEFTMLLPPPNITGALHLGHALTGAIQDAIVRWHRMKGHRTLWLPGTDHAGIATHAVVERKLMKEQGKTRHDLGREAFVQEIWKWKKEHGNTITKQMKLLGLSLDWSREYFTLDEKLSEAVTTAFCELFEKGLIYRDNRMINWSCALQSSLSDIEVDNLSVEGPTVLQVPGVEGGVEVGIIHHFAYQVADSDEQIIVATTRLETMLADTAVAVNPKDSRYAHLVGRKVIHPFDRSRPVPIIADSFVDMGFGTGAVKITPGHDAIDYEVGQRHCLPIIDILNNDGTLRKNVPTFGGMNRFVVRKKLKDALSAMGCYHGEHKHAATLPICSRTGDIVEPRLKEQWFLDCREMAQRAMQAVESGQLKITPDYNQIIWWEWLTKTQDWCLSRQLWWGHRIPVYTCMESKKTTCALSEEEAKKQLGSLSVRQDEDVLDTWFSSALLPFSAFGWPQKVGSGSVFSVDCYLLFCKTDTLDLEEFYPQHLMETGHDILFFWVARMVMLSLGLNDRLPFSKIFLHGMVRDAHGRKMSKSLGNVIDPLDIVNGITLEKLHKRLEEGNLNPREINVAHAGLTKDYPKGIAQCGVDALRFSLCSYNVKNVDINFDVTHAESNMRFCNKIWQSFKFILSKFSPEFVPVQDVEPTGFEDGTDLWILSRLSYMVQSCDSHFQTNDLHLVTGALQQFWYQELCDIYIEAVKPIFISDDLKRQELVQQILYRCAETFVLAAAPIMPFLCEELYQRLPQRGIGRSESVCVAEYPKPETFPWYMDYLDSSMKQVQDIIHHIQKLRKEYNIMGSKSHVYLQTDKSFYAEILFHHKTCLCALSRSNEVTILRTTADMVQGCATVYVNPDLKILVDLKGSTIDVEKELNRLHSKKNKLESEKIELDAKLQKLVKFKKIDSQEAGKLKSKITRVDKELEKIIEMTSTLSQNNVR